MTEKFNPDLLFYRIAKIAVYGSEIIGIGIALDGYNTNRLPEVVAGAVGYVWTKLVGDKITADESRAEKSNLEKTTQDKESSP